MKRSSLDRFMSHTEKDPISGCWNWSAQIDPDGYGRFSYKAAGYRSPLRAHRAAWLLLRGAIPAGMQIDHLCRNRRCVNPSHLELVTPKVNTERSFAPGTTVPRAERMQCKRGHPFSGENLGTRPDGHRKCLACMRDFQRAYLARKAST